jgi:hypothetical protein
MSPDARLIFEVKEAEQSGDADADSGVDAAPGIDTRVDEFFDRVVAAVTGPARSADRGHVGDRARTMVDGALDSALRDHVTRTDHCHPSVRYPLRNARSNLDEKLRERCTNVRCGMWVKMAAALGKLGA